MTLLINHLRPWDMFQEKLTGIINRFRNLFHNASLYPPTKCLGIVTGRVIIKLNAELTLSHMLFAFRKPTIRCHVKKLLRETATGAHPTLNEGESTFPVSTSIKLATYQWFYSSHKSHKASAVTISNNVMCHGAVFVLVCSLWVPPVFNLIPLNMKNKKYFCCQMYP